MNKKETIKKPPCQYGSKCFRKNPRHLQKFEHINDGEPSSKVLKINNSANEKLKNDVDNLLSAKEKLREMLKENCNTENCNEEISSNDGSSCDSSIMSKEDQNGKEEIMSDDVKSNKLEPGTKSSTSSDETVGAVLKSMPADFLDFWKFCTSLKKESPEKAFEIAGFHLVGIYDLLSKKLSENESVCLNCHWRYYYDPPEFQTVIKLDGKDLFHIGYFRDDPSELPEVLASNSANLGSKLTLMGDNIFAAMDIALTDRLKKVKNKKAKENILKIQMNLQEFAKKKKYSLCAETKKTKARNKKVVAKTFHNLGIVVPIKRSIGYRPLIETDSALRKILNSIVTSEDEETKLQNQVPLDEVITNVHYANDECDFGAGLHLGINLFCHGDSFFHPTIFMFLPLAYSLLKREKYKEIVEAHLKNRKMGDNLNDM